MKHYTTGLGETVRLSSVLGRGGEGTVYAVDYHQDIAAKIYLPNLGAERQAKIQKMVDAKLYASTGFVSFPLNTLFDGTGVFVGFTMKKMGGRTAVHQLYSPTSRKTAFPKATYPLLVRAASNVARAIASVHASGCVVGDINHSGVLVSEDATAALIDSDSFQFNDRGVVYRCRVGVPEFTPPELQHTSLDKVVRTENHDGFGLAVLIFYTLMMGRHPFAGRYLGSGDMPMERAIAECRFAYSARRSDVMMEPPPNVPTLRDLPLPLSDAFESAFGRGGATGSRPTAKEWTALLNVAESDLIPCSQSREHHYFRSAPSCPWCRMELAYPGFRAFSPTFPVLSGANPIDLGKLIAAARGTPDPGEVHDVAGLMPVVSLPGRVSVGIRKARIARWGVAISGAATGLTLLLAAAGPIEIVGLLVLLACVVGAMMAQKSPTASRAEIQRIRLAWQDAERAFRQAAGNSAFLKIRREAENLIGRLQTLPAEESRRLTELNAKKRDFQLHHYLERQNIETVRVKGIGVARKLTLKSYGIETAADVDYNRLINIPGFGPSTAASLMDWRRDVQARFRFNPAQDVNPLDVAAIKSDIAHRKADAENQLGQAVAALQRANSTARALRGKPGRETIEAWTALKRAQVRQAEDASTPLEIASIVVLALLAAGVVTLLTNLAHRPSVAKGPAPWSNPTSSLSASTSADQRGYAVATERAESDPKSPMPQTIITPNLIEKNNTVSIRPAEPSPPPMPQSSFEAAVPSPASPPATAPVSSTNVFSVTAPPFEIGPATPENKNDQSSQPLDIRPSATSVEMRPPGTVLLNLSDRSDAKQVQERLKVLGYYQGVADGVWGLRSRTALNGFRHDRRLAADGAWDIDIQRALMSKPPLDETRAKVAEPSAPHEPDSFPAVRSFR